MVLAKMGLALEADSLQHSHGRLVVGHAPRPDPMKKAAIEAELNDGRRSLSGVTLTPVPGTEIVANLTFCRCVRLSVIDQAALADPDTSNELMALLQTNRQL